MWNFTTLTAELEVLFVVCSWLKELGLPNEKGINMSISKVREFNTFTYVPQQ